MSNQHWKTAATEVLQTMAALTLSQEPNRTASFIQQAMKCEKLLTQAVNEPPSAIEEQAWSEGVKFAVLQMSRLLQPYANGRTISQLMSMLVREAMVSKGNGMQQSTEALRLTTAINQALELLDDATDSTAMDLIDQAEAILQNAVDEQPLPPE